MTTHPCAPRGWILQCLVRADADPSAHGSGTGSPTAAGIVPSFTSMFSLAQKSISGTTLVVKSKNTSFGLGAFQEGKFRAENPNRCVLKGWSFAEKPHRHLGMA